MMGLTNLDKVRHVELEATEFVVSHLVDLDAGERYNTVVEATFRPDLVDVMQMTMRRTVWGQTNKGVAKVSYPANWWQHVKQRFFPSWALAWWPVLKTTEIFDAKTLAPELVLPNRDGKRTAVIHIMAGGISF